MEPLVLFGAGMVVYCGYLAIMDEVADMKRSFAKSGVKSRRKAIGRGKRSGDGCLQRHYPPCSKMSRTLASSSVGTMGFAR